MEEKIFCKNCKNHVLEIDAYGTRRDRCSKSAAVSYDPIDGPIIIYRNCWEKNKIFDCKDFDFKS